MSSQAGKDVIYIDVDDEITTIIDKVRSADERIVALVLPKRATMLQSIVNMKLLKRTADGAKKHLVLITSEHGLLPLAGAVGIYVAKSLQSKPEIPNAPAGAARNEEENEESVTMAGDDDQLDKTRPVGEYAKGAATGAPVDLEEDEPIELDNETLAPASAGKKAVGKKGKKLKIPDFNKFRLLTILGAGGLILLIFLWYMAVMVMPRATISVKTDSSLIETNLDITLSSSAKEVEADAGVIPSKTQQSQKTATQQVETTGQKNIGTKASGEVTIKNCGPNEVTIPAGTAVSANGLTFITQSRIDLDDGKFGGVCKPAGEHIGTVDVVAQQAGEQYNLEPRSDYKVTGQDTTVTANGSQMSGGTSNIVKVVAQADIDSAKEKINSQDTNAVKLELKQGLQAQDLYPIEATFANANPDITTSAKVGDEAASVTVTQKATYTMIGVTQSNLKKIIAYEVNKHIDEKRQSILDYGIDNAAFKLQNQQGSNTMVSLAATAVAGSDLNLTEIKQQIAGKKANDAKELIGKNPGVTEVDVHYSPFWVSSIPKKTGKITLIVEKPTVKDAK